VDSVVGATGIVLTPVNNIAALGQVQLGGVEWSARSTDNTHIPAGTLVKVDRIEGVKVFVSPVRENATV
jgi:membrane protein implicated in regulation of membrane protease activity